MNPNEAEIQILATLRQPELGKVLDCLDLRPGDAADCALNAGVHDYRRNRVRLSDLTPLMGTPRPIPGDTEVLRTQVIPLNVPLCLYRLPVARK